MPCYDAQSERVRVEYRDDPVIQQLKDRLDLVTRLLCFVMKEQEGSSWYNTLSFGKFNDDYKRESVEFLLNWWKEHKKLDEEERVKQLEANARARRKALIINRLNETFSPEEINELKEII